MYTELLAEGGTRLEVTCGFPVYISKEQYCRVRVDVVREAWLSGPQQTVWAI